MLTAETMQLRVPLTKEQYAEASKGPRKYRKAMLAQPKLIPGHSLPISVAIGDMQNTKLRLAAADAMTVWNERMVKYAGVEHAFKVGYRHHADITVDTAPMDYSYDPKTEFGSMPVGALVSTHRPSFGGFGSMDEFGECVHYWNKRFKIYAGTKQTEVYIAEDLTGHRVLVSILAHELGHCLLLGHDPIHPWRLMYRHHTDVYGPTPKECGWVKEIWE